MEIVGTWRSVVSQNKINKAQEEAVADIQGNLEENETACGRWTTILNNGYYVFSASDGDSNTLHIMIKNEPVGVITDSGATYNLMTEQAFDKMYKGKLELLKTDRKVYTCVRERFLRARVTLGLNSPRMRIKRGKEHGVL